MNLSIVSDTINDTTMANHTQVTSSSSNDAILTLLQDMNKSNQEIVRAIDSFECQQPLSSTPVACRSQPQVHNHPVSMTGQPVPDLSHAHQVGVSGHSNN